MTSFHRLPVAAVDQLTDDAVCVTFAVPPGLRGAFAFQAGQHVTLRRPAGPPPAGSPPGGSPPDGAVGAAAPPDGVAEVRRSYSICSTPALLRERGLFRIGVRRLPGGEFSEYAMRLRAGDDVPVLPPVGQFTSAFAAGRSRRYAAVAAGSGITPVLSLVSTALAVEAGSRFTLVYANRASTTVMFAEDLADLKDRYPSRLHLIHVLSREGRGAELFSGRLDAARFGRVLDALLPVDGVDEWFLCGPYGLVVDARQVLAQRRVPTGAVHAELFHVAQPPAPHADADDDGAPGAGADGAPDSGGAQLRFVLNGRTSTVIMRSGERVLDAALRVRPELPYACRGGVCSTCRARLTEGRVEMARNYALEPAETAAGYVLTCQSSPRTERLSVDYDG